MKLSALIIDDETNAREALANLLERYCPDVVVKGQANSAAAGIELIKAQGPDMVFLDVEMPSATGFSLLESMRGQVNFEVIFTTAHDHYALKAIKYSALDYLLKPVNVDELQVAVQKVKLKKQQASPSFASVRVDSLLQNLQGEQSKMPLPTRDGYSFINMQDIVRIEADSNYSNVFLENGEKILVTRTLKDVEEMLPTYFYRVHKSHIVNLYFVKKYVRFQANKIVLADGKEVELAIRKKEDFLQRMKNLK